MQVQEHVELAVTSVGYQMSERVFKVVMEARRVEFPGLLAAPVVARQATLVGEAERRLAAVPPQAVAVLGQVMDIKLKELVVAGSVYMVKEQVVRPVPA